jgi:hypothetical protein
MAHYTGIMLASGKRLWRSHPVLMAALVGAASGVAEVLVTEIAGLLRGGRDAVLPLFLAPVAAGSHVRQLGAVQTAFVLLIDVAANVAVFALLFAVPVAIVFGIRRVLRRQNQSS